jgi:hypothetical protein
MAFAEPLDVPERVHEVELVEERGGRDGTAL